MWLGWEILQPGISLSGSQEVTNPPLQRIDIILLTNILLILPPTVNFFSCDGGSFYPLARPVNPANVYDANIIKVIIKHH